MSHNHFDLTIDALEVEAAKKEAEAAELRRTANSLRALRSGESIVPTQKLLPAPSTNAQASPANADGSKKKCLVAVCKKPEHSRGLCSPHYQRYCRQRHIKSSLTIEGFAKAASD